MIPARDVFTLMTKSGVTEEYSLKLVKTSPDICYYHIAPNIIQAHKNVLQMNNALYSIQRSVINTFHVDKGFVVTLTYLLAKYHTKYICVWLQLKHTMVQEIRTPSTFNILMLII